MHSDAGLEPHLAINHITLPPASEWIPQMSGWVCIMLAKGIGYWQHPEETKELSTGAVLVAKAPFPGLIRSSRLTEAHLAYFFVRPENLTGLLSLTEQTRLERAAARRPTSIRLVGPDDARAERFKSLCQGKTTDALLRLRLVEMFLEYMEADLKDEAGERPCDKDARARLRELLGQMAAAELCEFALTDLSPRIHCSPRHFSRLFRKEMGMSFREKQNELRLTRACQLLSSTDNRVVDIALASGFRSGSLFGLIFKNRFGVSPGHWRRQRQRKGLARQRVIRMLPA